MKDFNIFLMKQQIKYIENKYIEDFNSKVYKIFYRYI